MASLALGRYNATPPTITDTKTEELQLDVNGNLLVSLASSSADSVLVDDAAFTPGTSNVTVVGFLADETATDSVNEGDSGAARITLDRKQIMANNYIDDAAFTVEASYVGAVGFIVNDSGVNTVDEGDVGIARMSADRKIIIAGAYSDDAAISPGSPTTHGVLIGGIVDETGTDSVDEGDFAGIRSTTNRNLYVTLGQLLSGEDQTNGVFAVSEKPMSANTYSPDQDTSAAAEASSVTKASAGNLFGVTATNSSGSLRYWQMFNSTTVPADTTVPVLSIPVAAGGEISREWPKGKYFSTGMSWAWSSTAATKTVGSTDGITTVDYK